MVFLYSLNFRLNLLLTYSVVLVWLRVNMCIVASIPYLDRDAITHSDPSGSATTFRFIMDFVDSPKYRTE